MAQPENAVERTADRIFPSDEEAAFRKLMDQCMDTEPFADEANLKQNNMQHEWFTSQQAFNERNRILPGKASHLDRNWILAEQELMHGCQTGPEFKRYDKLSVNVQLSGDHTENMPEKLETFEEIFENFPDRVPAELKENLNRCGYKIPTPVQKYAIPAGLADRDVICCAPTGSGKTGAYLIPMLSSTFRFGQASGKLEEPFSGAAKPDTVILAPTRELCEQIFREALKFCHKTYHLVVKICGGETTAKCQVQELAAGADVVIATPGRLWAFAQHGDIINLSKVECLVIDEADNMLSCTMRYYLNEIIMNSENTMHSKGQMKDKLQRQTMMFSATYPHDVHMQQLQYLHTPIQMQIGAVGSVGVGIEQKLIQVQQKCKYKQLRLVLSEFQDGQINLRSDDWQRLIVFCNSKWQVENLDKKLQGETWPSGARRDFYHTVLHRGLTQPDRDSNLLEFRWGSKNILVTTDISRGLHIDGVTWVINYDLPCNNFFSSGFNTYIQRIGRTGRIGNIGYAVTFISKDGEQFNDFQLPVLLELPTVLGKNEVPDWLERLLWTEKGVTVEQVQQAQVQNIFHERQHPTEEAVHGAVDSQSATWWSDPWWRNQATDPWWNNPEVEHSAGVENCATVDKHSATVDAADDGDKVEDPGEKQTVGEPVEKPVEQQHSRNTSSSWGSYGSIDSFIKVFR